MDCATVAGTPKTTTNGAVTTASGIPQEVKIHVEREFASEADGLTWFANRDKPPHHPQTIL